MLSRILSNWTRPAKPVSSVNTTATSQLAQQGTPPPPFLEPRCHPLEPQITKEVDGYFIEHWPFPNEEAIQKFRDAGFSRVTCCYYPEAHNDRIHFGCRLLTLLFLIDGLPEKPSCRVMQITRIRSAREYVL